MQYTTSKADWFHDTLSQSHETHVIDVGEADESVVRWWTAILAKHEGWKAIVRQTITDEFLAPWAVSRT